MGFGGVAVGVTSEIVGGIAGTTAGSTYAENPGQYNKQWQPPRIAC